MLNWKTVSSSVMEKLIVISSAKIQLCLASTLVLALKNVRSGVMDVTRLSVCAMTTRTTLITSIAPSTTKTCILNV